MALSSFPLLKLPPELRNLIYKHYVTIEGGYVYHFDTGKLCAANDRERPIDLALAYTCTRVANEMRGLALGANVITFRTVSSPDLDLRACRFHNIMRSLDADAELFLGSHEYSSAHGYWAREDACIRYDQRVLDEVSRAFPQCQAFAELTRIVRQGSPPLYNQSYNELEFLMSDSLKGGWCEVPSVKRELFLYAVEAASKLGCSFHQPLRGGTAHDILELASMLMPWTIPTVDEVKYAARQLCLQGTKHDETRIGKISPFSAAAAAIRFLNDTPISTRKYIRKIVIHEDRVSVASPECHGKGLIPFCVENSLLRIERRLDLWRTVLESYSGLDICIDGQVTDPLGGSYGWSLAVAQWVVEARDLVRAGMPEKSFSLVIDGGPAPEKASEVFQRMQRDAAWQEAFEKACVRNIRPTPSLAQQRRLDVYVCENFPNILKSMTNNKSFFIRCNFDIGASWDIEQIVHQNQAWSLSDWETNCKLEIEADQGVAPFPPFESWRDFYIGEYVNPAERWRYADRESSFQLSMTHLTYPEN